MTPIAIWSFIWAIIDRMYEYTNWLNKIGDNLFLIYIVGLLIIYIAETIANEINLSRKNEKLELSQKGLLNQHRIDMNDKQKLKSQIELKDLFIKILSTKLPKDKSLEAKQQFDLLKEMADIEQNNENSKNN